MFFHHLFTQTFCSFSSPFLTLSTPSQRHEHREHGGEDIPHHESWHELFFDLFYVALFIKLGDLMKSCSLSFNIVFSVFVIFLIAWVTQLHMGIYMNRFYAEDLFHKLLYLLQHAGLFIMFLNVNETAESLMLLF